MDRIGPRYAVPLALATLLPAMFPAGAAVADDAPIVPVSTNVGCDPLDPAICLFPFPNDHFTVTDDSTDTGRRIAFSPFAMPRGGAEVTEGGEGKPARLTALPRFRGGRHDFEAEFLGDDFYL